MAEDLLWPTRLGEATIPALCLRASSAGATPSCLLCLIKKPALNSLTMTSTVAGAHLCPHSRQLTQRDLDLLWILRLLVN